MSNTSTHITTPAETINNRWIKPEITVLSVNTDTLGAVGLGLDAGNYS